MTKYEKFYNNIYLDNIERMTTLGVARQLVNTDKISEPIEIIRDGSFIIIKINALSYIPTLEYNAEKESLGFTIQHITHKQLNDFNFLFMKHFNYTYEELRYDVTKFFSIDFDIILNFFIELIDVMYKMSIYN